MSEDLSPAERFAKAKQTKRHASLDNFISLLKFPLDDFQEKACRALVQGHGVLVAAPTGAGKTIVGEFAVDLVINSGGINIFDLSQKVLVVVLVYYLI